ncbi:hypothetical protein Tco_1207819 [Tanacetum coccineum]
MRSGDNEANVSKIFKKDDVPRKTRSLAVAEERVADKLAKSINTYAEWGQKLKGPVVEDPTVQSLLDLQKGSKANRLESLKQKKQAVAGEGSSVAHIKYDDTSDTKSDVTCCSSCSDTLEESANGTNDADDSDLNLSDDNPDKDDDTAGFGVFMYNKSTETPKSTYLRPTITTSSLDFIQNLLDETPVNELTDLMSNLVYTYAPTTLVVHNLDGNHEVRSFLSCASEVPFVTHVDVQATKLILQEIFLDDRVIFHHKLPTNLQPNSLQAKSKKLMQKAKKNMRKIKFKKAVAQNFREYDQKLEALTNFNVSEAFKKAVQAKSNDTHTTHQQLHDTLYDSITMDQQALDAQDAEPSFHKRSHDNWDTPNDHEGEKRKKQRKDSGSAGAAKRKITWFDLLLKSNIDQNENHILRPSTITIEKKLKEIIQKDELIIADLEGVLSEAKWNSDEDDVSKPRTFERHMSKNTKPHPSFYNNNFYYLVSLSTEEKYTTSITKHYAARYYKQDSTINFFKEKMSNQSKGKIYSNLRIELVVRIVVKKKWGYGFLTSIVVRRSDDQEYEFSYADLPRLSLNDVEDMYLLQV